MTVKELVDNVTKFEMGSFGYLGMRSVIFEKIGEKRTVRCEGSAYIFEKNSFIGNKKLTIITKQK